MLPRNIDVSSSIPTKPPCNHWVICAYNTFFTLNFRDTIIIKVDKPDRIDISCPRRNIFYLVGRLYFKDMEFKWAALAPVPSINCKIGQSVLIPVGKAV